MKKPTGARVAQTAARRVAQGGIAYADEDCQAFVENTVNACMEAGDAPMAFAGSNDMARNAVSWLGTLRQARAEGRLRPGAALFIREDAGEPERYRADGLGNFSHVGLYLGPGALRDTDKDGAPRDCDVAHSSATMGRAAGSTLQNGWTHAGWLLAVDYGDAGSDGEQNGAAREETAARPDVRAVATPDGKPVKLRRRASARCREYWNLPDGARVTAEREKDGWTLVTGACTDGRTRRAWVQSRFLKAEGGDGA